MVTLWKLVSALSAKAKKPPGLRRIPHSLEVELFFAQRAILTHLMHLQHHHGPRNPDRRASFIPPTTPSLLPSSSSSASSSSVSSEGVSNAVLDEKEGSGEDKEDSSSSLSTSPSAKKVKTSTAVDLHSPPPLQVLQDVLQILFQLPHLERIFKSHFGESENILRVLNSGTFYQMTDEDVLPIVQRFCGLFLDTMREQLTTANLILVATLLQRSDWNWLRGGNPWKASQRSEKENSSEGVQVSASSSKETNRSGSESSAGSVTGLADMRHRVSEEAAQRYQEIAQLQGGGGGTNNSTSPSPPPFPDTSRPSSSRPVQHQHLEHWRENLLSDVYRMCYQRLQFNVENGFPDDTLATLCKGPASFKGFHHMQSDSLVKYMTCAEFTFFFNLLNERIKRKQVALQSITPTFDRTRGSGLGSSEIDTGVERDMDALEMTKVVEGVPPELIQTVGVLLDRLCFFQNMEVVAEHRPIHIEELRFIVSIMLSPIPSWSKVGMEACRKFVQAHYHAHPERGTHSQEVLSTMKLEDQNFIRAYCLRRLLNAPLTQLSECFTYLLPLFVYPTVVTDAPTGGQKVRWVPCSTLLSLTLSQKKRLFTVARSSLHLMRLRPVVGHIVQKMIPSPLPDQPFADDDVILQLVTNVSEFFLSHAKETAALPLSSPPRVYSVSPSLSSSSGVEGDDNEEASGTVNAANEERMETERIVLSQERARAYFAACEHCWFRHQKSPWLVQRGPSSSTCARATDLNSSSATIARPFSTPEEQAYFAGFVRYLLPEAEATPPQENENHSTATPPSIPRLLNTTVVHGLLDLMVAIFTFLRSVDRLRVAPPVPNDSSLLSTSTPSPQPPAASNTNEKETSPNQEASSSTSPPWSITNSLLPQQLEVSLLSTVTHLVAQQAAPPIRADLLQQILRYSVQTLTLNYMFSHARQTSEATRSASAPQRGVQKEEEDEETASASYLEAIAREKNSVPTAAAELAAACLDLYMSSTSHGRSLRRTASEGGSATEAPVKENPASSITTHAAIALNIQGLPRDKHEEKQALVSLAVLSVSLLNGLILPSSHQHLQNKALHADLLKSLFQDFDTSPASLVNVHELLALVFTQRVPAREGALVASGTGGRTPSLSSMTGTASGSSTEGSTEDGKGGALSSASSSSTAAGVVRYSKTSRRRPVTMVMTPPLRSDEEESDFVLAVDAADTSLLEAGLLSARRITYHHQCYVPLTLQERIRVVEHCIRIYLSVQHRFCVLDVAQAAGIRCLSACAYLCIEDQLKYHESGRVGEYERRRMSHLAQALWHFYSMAMDRPVHSGPQVEKYTRMIMIFLRTRVAMIPHRRGVSVYDESNELCVFASEVNGHRVQRSTRITGGFRPDLAEGRGGGGGYTARGSRWTEGHGRSGSGASQRFRLSLAMNDAVVEQWNVKWINLPQIKKVNTIFVQFISKLSVQSMSRFTERTGITFSTIPSAARLADPDAPTPLHSTTGRTSPQDSSSEKERIPAPPAFTNGRSSEKDFFLLQDAEDRLLSSLTVYERDLLFRNVALRRALRYPVHCFQVAIANAQKDNLPARRAVLLSELYMTIVHTHAHELLPDMWKEVCTQLMFFRQIYFRADSPGVCVLDTKMGKEVQQFMHQLLVQYLHFEDSLKPTITPSFSLPVTGTKDTTTLFSSTAPEDHASGVAVPVQQVSGGGPPRSLSGCFLDLSSLSFLYSSTVKASQSAPLPVPTMHAFSSALSTPLSAHVCASGKTTNGDVLRHKEGRSTGAAPVFRSQMSSTVEEEEKENVDPPPPPSSAVPTETLRPSDLHLIATSMKREIEVGVASTAWESMSERQYAGYVSILHRGLRDVLGN